MESAAHTNPSLLSIRQQGRSPECVGGEHTSPCTQTDDVNERELIPGKKKEGPDYPPLRPGEYIEHIDSIVATAINIQ